MSCGRSLDSDTQDLGDARLTAGVGEDRANDSHRNGNDEAVLPCVGADPGRKDELQAPLAHLLVSPNRLQDALEIETLRGPDRQAEICDERRDPAEIGRG